ncbi:hypothetical protein M501DRAFT_1005649 [Patellaria atrata CBS 101060]|uniref:ABC transporter n=1 Tax=Patellaria atrata CBS 101060 TaxID=1346257 RepID=A0A9P4VTB5_9PEZI|nr:hypothetical protein M501DRAFT_1005649 [Patellaria atrata CBS 101060]
MAAPSPSSLSCQRIDNTFGPYAEHCRGGFDFTLLFEQSILSVPIVSVFLLIAPLRIWYLFTKSAKATGGILLTAKLIFGVIFSALQLALLVLWAQNKTGRTDVSIPSAALLLVLSLLLPLLSYAEHIHSLRPSLIINGYLFFSLLFDIAQSRTLWLQGYMSSHAIVLTISTVVKFVLLVLESLEKRRYLKPEYKDEPKEAIASPISRGFFWWLNPLFLRGYGNLLALDDLYFLDKHLQSTYLSKLLHAGWNRVSKKGSHALFWTTIRTLKWPILTITVPRLCLIGFQFCQPFLINRAISLSQEPVDEHTTNIGYGLIGAYIIVYLGMAVTTGQYQHLTYRAITMARGGLVSMLFRKTADLSIQSVDPSASLTLMSADIERIATGWQTMPELYGNSIEIALAIYLLYRQLGVACLIPIAVAIISMVGSLIVTSLVMARQQLWLEAIERRIAATTAMLGAMKGVKMCGLTEILQKNIHDLRVEELQISKKFRKLLIWNMAISYITPVVAPILTFAVFSVLAKNNGTRTLDTARVFTSLSLFALLSEPLASLIMALATFMGAIGCFDRIEAFIKTEPRVDARSRPMNNYTIDYRSSQEKSQSDLTESSTEKSEQNSLFHPDAVVIQDGNFGWDMDKEPLLHEISIVVPRGKLTMIVGPVGCGKSTLVKAILGEIPAMKGIVQVSSLSVAYCDQTPWLMNGTIKESIVGFTPFNAVWYASVVRACALEEDFRQLPRGDDTWIGSKGIALSGGQSQRISLARAVYAQRELVIIDDVLSGLDSDTESRVFRDVFRLLRGSNSTVIMASSSTKRVPDADYVVVLTSDGHIAEQGTFEELAKLGGYISSFDLQASKGRDDSFLDDMEKSNSSITLNEVKPEIAKLVETDESTKAESNRRTGDVSIYIYYVGSIGWFPTFIFVFAITSFVFCFSFPNIWLKWWATANAEDPNERLGYYLGIYGLLGGLAILSLVVSCWQMIITMVPRSGERFHWTLLTTVLKSPLSFFATTDTGITINRFSQDLQLIDMELPISALNTFATFVLVIAQMVLIGVASVYAAIAFPICLTAIYFIQKFYLRTSRQLRFLDLEAKSPLYSHFIECLNGLATVRAFGWQQDFEDKNREMLDRSQRPFYLLFSVQRWLTVVLDLMVAAIAVLLIVLVVKLRGTISAGYVGVALLNVIMFSQSIKMLITFWTMLETHIGAIARIKNFTAEAVSEDLESENDTPPPSWPSKGAIEFRSVSAGYKVSEPVVKNISFTIRAGEKIGICGRTGSGKSSMILSLFRMLELAGGSIIVDGVDISTVPRNEVRSRLIGVPQDAYILKGSVRLNATPTGTAADEAIVSALKSVQLWEIIKRKGGLDADIDNLHLSHGQRQLFCLARAMLRPSTVLVLDEATSSIDSKTDDIMQKVIREKFASHTVIAVAHKLDTILDFDKVAVMEAGSMIEFESPHSLLERPSAFRSLYRNLKKDEYDHVESEDNLDEKASM